MGGGLRVLAQEADEINRLLFLLRTEALEQFQNLPVLQGILLAHTIFRNDAGNFVDFQQRHLEGFGGCPEHILPGTAVAGDHPLDRRGGNVATAGKLGLAHLPDFELLV